MTIFIMEVKPRKYICHSTATFTLNYTALASVGNMWQNNKIFSKWETEDPYEELNVHYAIHNFSPSNFYFLCYKSYEIWAPTAIFYVLLNSAWNGIGHVMSTFVSTICQ